MTSKFPHAAPSTLLARGAARPFLSPAGPGFLLREGAPCPWVSFPGPQTYSITHLLAFPGPCGFPAYSERLAWLKGPLMFRHAQAPGSQPLTMPSHSHNSWRSPPDTASPAGAPRHSSCGSGVISSTLLHNTQFLCCTHMCWRFHLCPAWHLLICLPVCPPPGGLSISLRIETLPLPGSAPASSRANKINLDALNVQK